MRIPAVPVSIVDQDWIDRTENYQKKKLIRIGTFDLEYLAKMVDILSNETLGEIEILAGVDNIMPDGSLSGLLVAKYDGKNYVALAGISHGSPIDKEITPEEAMGRILEEYRSNPKKYRSMAHAALAERYQSTALVECTGAVCIAVLMQVVEQ